MNIKWLFVFSLLISPLLNLNAAVIQRPVIGLVLGGGGAKGFAHIGILKMLDSLQIPIDLIAGTSMGGITGALYSVGYSGKEQEQLVRQTDWQEIFTDTPERALLPYFQRKEQGRYQLTFGLEGVKPVTPLGLINGQKISLLFSSLTFPYENVKNFDQLPVPFRCVTVDLTTGREVVLSRGSLAKAMRATMSIPTVFAPVDWGDSLLVDGGLYNNLPVDVVKSMGADFVIAVDVSMPLQQREKLKSGMSVINQILAIYDHERWQRNVNAANIYIRPDISQFSTGDFDARKIKGIIKCGDLEARSHLADFVALKNQWNLGPKLSQEGENQADSTKSNTLYNLKRQIYGISIEGNQALPFSFVYRLLGLRPGSEFNPAILNQRITELYALGYFETINYEIEPIQANQIRLKLIIKEKPLRQLRLGIRYDDLRKMVGVAQIAATNLLVPGLRWDFELQFAGLTQTQFKIYYPSRTLHVSVYPFLRHNYVDISRNIFDRNGKKIARYNEHSPSAAVGIGTLFGKSTNLEIEFQHEDMKIEPYIAVNDPERFPLLDQSQNKIQLALDFDKINDILLPRSGSRFNLHAEDNLARLKSGTAFWKIEISSDFYRTYLRKHTLRLHGYWGMCSRSTPVYKYPNRGWPEFFVGVDYDELVGNKLGIARIEYRFEYKKDIFLSLIANSALQYEYWLAGKTYTSNNIQGVGIGVKLLSPIGPLDFMYVRGPKNFYHPDLKSDKFYVRLGYFF